MQLSKLRLQGFQSFKDVTEIDLSTENYFLGPNGSGKTAVLQALCRMFGIDKAYNKLCKSDFFTDISEGSSEEKRLWIEAEFSFPELLEEEQETIAIPPNFNHMSLMEIDGIPQVRIRLSATLFPDGSIEEELLYVIATDENEEPITTLRVPRADRNNIQVHYLPALRNPESHIAYSTSSYLGRILRASNWEGHKDNVQRLTADISEELSSNSSVTELSEALNSIWSQLHKGSHYSNPKIDFVAHEIEALLRNLSLSFSPGHGEEKVVYSRLSDGQKSLLYLSIVFASHRLGRRLLSGEDVGIDIEKFTPPIFSILAIEEPENSLSPHYLGRIMRLSKEMIDSGGAQVLMATHSPSIMSRVDPRNVRFLRLNEDRSTQVQKVLLPNDESEQKYVREAILAFPELYFSRLVVLGEGDSEEIVIPRLLRAKERDLDIDGVSVVPLGGRHVNHFWRLLDELKIPHVTLLDLDLARHGGGWGRIKTVCDQLLKNSPPEWLTEELKDSLPKWDSETKLSRSQDWFDFLEKAGVFYSSPLDLDFSMLKAFPSAYGLIEEDNVEPTEKILNSVLGESHFCVEQYDEGERKLFQKYKQLFKGKGKPTSHIEGLSNITDQELADNMPAELSRFVAFIIEKLEGLPE